MSSFLETSANRKAISDRDQKHDSKKSFFDKAKEVIAKNQDVLSALEELDRTGKLRKIAYKTKVSFTIDEELFNKFRAYCKQNGINMSGRIESYIRNELKKNKINQ